jgi:hypothetical protein
MTYLAVSLSKIMKRTIFEVIYDKFKTKPATDAEITQLKKDLEREQLKASIREVKQKHKGGSGLDKFLKVTETMFGKTQDVKTPRF